MTELKRLLDALSFAEGAVLDAISHEDGLDGGTGYRVLQIIWEHLAEHGETSCADDKMRLWLADTYGEVTRYAMNRPVSIRNRELEAEVERLKAIITTITNSLANLNLPGGTDPCTVIDALVLDHKSHVNLIESCRSQTAKRVDQADKLAAALEFVAGCYLGARCDSTTTTIVTILRKTREEIVAMQPFLEDWQMRDRVAECREERERKNQEEIKR